MLRFNRSILKCKIEAYWNVNIEGAQNLTDSPFGLIEAYWNVNAFPTTLNLESISGLIEAYWNVNACHCFS